MNQVFFVSPQGNDNNIGSKSAPFATIQKAHELVQPGDTIYLRGGRYSLPKDKATVLSKSGTQDNPIRLFAYKDETPILDASDWTRAAIPYDPATKNIIIQDGDAWHVKGLELTGGPRTAYLARSVSDSRWENLNIHRNENTGFNLSGENANNNLILNSDFHHNFDPIRRGQDADGVGLKFGSGTGNVIRNSRFYNNSDDGIDFWMFESAVTLENNWSFGNGVDRWDFGPTFEGNGNGYKLGGGRPTIPAVDHRVLNNLAWGNVVRGFDYNGNEGSMQVINNTSFNNGDIGFLFTRGSHTLQNNLSLGGERVFVGDSVQQQNSWNLSDPVTESDVLSVDSAIAEGPRQSNGNLPVSDFLRLAPDSSLIDAGVDVGQNFQGAAPDIGAFESNPQINGTSGLVVQLQFDQQQNATLPDTSPEGQQNPGLLRGSSRLDAGLRGNAVSFSRPKDVVAIRNSPDINQTIQAERSISFWFRGQDTVQSRPQVLYEEGGTIRGLNVYLNDGQLYVGGWNQRESDWSGTWLKTDQIESGEWHHVTLVLDGTETVQSDALKGYLDGQEFGSGEGSQLWAHPDLIGIGNVRGKTRLESGVLTRGQTQFQGLVDEFQIFNRVLSAEEIQAIATPIGTATASDYTVGSGDGSRFGVASSFAQPNFQILNDDGTATLPLT